MKSFDLIRSVSRVAASSAFAAMFTLSASASDCGCQASSHTQSIGTYASSTAMPGCCAVLSSTQPGLHAAEAHQNYSQQTGLNAAGGNSAIPGGAIGSSGFGMAGSSGRATGGGGLSGGVGSSGAQGGQIANSGSGSGLSGGLGAGSAFGTGNAFGTGSGFASGGGVSGSSGVSQGANSSAAAFPVPTFPATGDASTQLNNDTLVAGVSTSREDDDTAIGTSGEDDLFFSVLPTGSEFTEGLEGNGSGGAIGPASNTGGSNGLGSTGAGSGIAGSSNVGGGQSQQGSTGSQSSGFPGGIGSGTTSNPIRQTAVSSGDNTGTNDPGTNDPGTNDPGTNDPGTNDPGTNDPGTNDPGTNDPGTNDPGTNDPGFCDPQEPSVDVPPIDNPSDDPADDPADSSDPGTSDPGGNGSDPPVVPEPGSILMLGMGAAIGGLMYRRRRRQQV